MKVNKIDSAAYYFNKQYALDNNLQKLSAVEHMMKLYSEVGQVDSVKKYAKLYIEKRDEFDRVSNGNQMQALHLRFNFDKLNNKLAEKAHMMNQMIIGCLLVCLVAVVLMLINRSRYLKAILEKEQLYYELASLKIKFGVRPKERVSWKILSEQAKETEIYRELTKNLMASPPKAIDKEQKERLYEKFILLFPAHYDMIMSNRLSGVAFDVCVLNLFDFKPGEICKLLDVAMARITNIRSRLCNTLFNLPAEDSSASRFDELLRQYGS